MNVIGILSRLLAVLAIGGGLVLTSGAMPVEAAPTTLFVRPGGNDVFCNGRWNADASVAAIPNCAFRTLQQGNDSASAGDRVRVSAGTYTSNSPSAVLRITKRIRFLGPNAGVDPTSESAVRASEAIIDGEQERTGVALLSSGAILDGFTVREGAAFYNGSYPASVFSDEFDNWSVRYNIVEARRGSHRIAGAGCSAANAARGCTIEYNRIRETSGPGNSVDYSGIAVLFRSRHLTIRGNDAAGGLFSRQFYVADTEGGHANLSIVENKVSSVHLESVNRADVSGNHFTFAPVASIRLAFTNRVRIRNNPFDTSAIYMAEGNHGVYIIENSFQLTAPGLGPLAVRITLGNIGTVRMVRNWYGSADGPEFDPPPGQGAHISDERPVFDVDYEPWLCSGEDTDLLSRGFQPDLSSLGSNATPCAGRPG